MPKITLLEGDILDNDFHVGYNRGHYYSWGVECEGGQAFLIQDYAGVTGGDVRKLAELMDQIFHPLKVHVT